MTTKTKKRRMGRPRIRDTGSRGVDTQLGPAPLAAVRELAKEEGKSVARVLTDLIEHALRARGRLK